MPNPTQPMNEEELKKAIEYIFGYDEEETTRGEFNSFNRHPEYVFIQDITKKHTTGKSYHAIEKQLLELMQNDRNAAIREARAEKPSIHVFDTWLSIDMGAEIRFEPAGMWGQRVWQNGGTYVCSGKEVNGDKTSITDHVNYRFTKIGDASYGTGGYKDVFISGKDIKKWIEDGASGDLENYQGWFTLQSQPNAKEGE